MKRTLSCEAVRVSMLIPEDAETKQANILQHFKDHHHLIHGLIFLIDIKFRTRGLCS